MISLAQLDALETGLAAGAVTGPAGHLVSVGGRGSTSPRPSATPTRTCRYCGQRNAQRRRLCRPCYNTPGVREQYTPAGRIGVGGGCGGYRPPPAPTTARPGTPEKVAVLEERARLGLSLWHPRDAPMDRESADLDVF